MQLSKFSTGGMVAHRVIVPEYADRKFSVWTDANGVLVDACSTWRCRADCIQWRNVKPGSKQWRHVAARAARIFRTYDELS